MAAAHRFTAKIARVWIMRVVDLPPKVSAAFTGPHVPVAATCNGIPFRGTLVPAGGGCFRLTINGTVRRAAGGVDTGDTVVMTVRQTKPHAVPEMPVELAKALAAHQGGRLAFESWPPGRRRQVVAWVAAGKATETRARRVARVLERLGFAPTLP